VASDPITAGLNIVDKFIGKFVKDKDLAAKLSAEARSQEFAGELQLLVGQMEINKAEAAHKSIFVSGWRPFIGWVCGVGLLYNVLLSPILDVWFTMPEIDPGLLYPVLMGMLGLGGMRTAEKFKGVARAS
tara:strand:+ start:1372 stop:1761 length:390 start_codon:yes stop_codon:yes gene_type:complete